MKTREINILTQALAPIVRDFVAQKIEPVLMRVHGLEAQCEQLKTRVRLLESKNAVPPSTPLPVVRLSAARRRHRIVRL
jgi:hypothetical protein